MVGSCVSKGTRVTGGIVAGVVAALVFAPLGSAAHATADRHDPSPVGRAEIAFVSNRDANDELYASNPEGTAIRRLTHTVAEESAPAWSPDHSRLAFFTLPEGSENDPFNEAGQVWTMDADGSHARLLRSGVGAGPFSVAWSPDGRRLAFAFHRAEGSGNSAVVCGELWIMDGDGSGARPVLQSQPVVTGLDWSPDGKRIVYGLDPQMSCEGGAGLWTMNDDGSDQRSLDAPSGESPSWSPDGSTIAFTDWRNTCHACGELWLMDADGSHQRPLVAEPDASSWKPSWSPGGARIAFEGGTSGPAELLVVAADGSRLTKVADNARDPAW